MAPEKMSKPSLGKLSQTRRKRVSSSPQALVKTGHLDGAPIPLVIQPAVDGVNLLEWTRTNKPYIDTLLGEHRALLFRGFHVATTEEFYQFVTATSDADLLEYRDRSSPRHAVGDRIYTSTDYPAEQRILLHNEGTYWLTWPLKILFYCHIPPETGGETPIADCRNVYNHISPETRARFLEKKVLYVRNYNDGFGLTWQTVYQTEDRAEVEAYCRQNSIEFEWKSGDRLRTRQIRPAIVHHPKTGEPVWFNHAYFFNILSLEPAIREGLLAEFDEGNLPYNTYYGDGTPIEPEVLQEIGLAYDREKLKFAWQKGDVILLDNTAIAHGRESYTGDRKILVGMSEPYHRQDVV